MVSTIEEWSRAFLGTHPISRRGEACWCHLRDDDPIHQPSRIDRDGYHVFWSSGIESLAHLEGVDWADAPLPPRRHRCWAQSKGFFRDGPVWRCACGAICRGDGDWWEVNSRQRADEPKRGLWSWLRRKGKW